MSVDLEKLNWIKENQHICMNPWSNATIRLDEDGTPLIDPCCNILRSKRYKPFSTEPIENMKTAMQQGYLPAECSLCKTDEDNGLLSERMRHLLTRNLKDIKEFAETKQHGSFLLGAKFSNLCNMACRSCNEFESSLWGKIYNQPAPDYMNMDLSDLPEFWENLEKIYKDSQNKSIGFVPIGGETILQPGFEKTLNWFLEKGYDKNIEYVYITTNFTVMKKSMLNLLSKFNKVIFSGSIDGVNDNFHYLRWPEKFTTIEKNLDKMSELFDKNKELNYNKFNFEIIITWSLNNIWHIEEIMDYWYNWQTKNNVSLKMAAINLYDPKFLSVHTIPNPYRKILLEKVEKILKHPIFSIKESENMQMYFIQLKNTLKNNNLINYEEFKSYLEHTADADIRNNVQMKDYNKLYECFTERDKKILQYFYNIKAQ